MPRRLFLVNDGVDQAFCGHYGHEDTFFVTYNKELGVTFEEADITMDCTSHDFTPGTFYTLNRDTTRNEQLLSKGSHSRMLLGFEWEFVDGCRV